MKSLRIAMFAASALIIVALTFLLTFLLDSESSQSPTKQFDRPEAVAGAQPLPPGGRRMPEGAVPSSPTVHGQPSDSSPNRALPVRTGETSGYNLAGTVCDLGGDPVANAIVWVRLVSGERAATLERRTDRDGRFRIDNLPIETIPLLTVRADGYQETSIENIALPASDLNIYLKPLTGVTVEVMRAEAGSMSPWTDEVTLHLLRRSESVAPPLRTSGMAEAGRPLGGYSAIRTDKFRSADGRHYLRDIPPGTYRLIAQAGLEYAESAPFTVEAVGSSQCRLILGLRGVLRGRVVDAETSAPLEGAIARLAQTGRPPIAGAPLTFEARAGHDGAFELRDVIPSQYTLTLGADKYSTRSIEELTIRPGDNGEAVTYELAKGQASLSVRVLAPTGAPADGVRLALLNESPAADTKARFLETDRTGVARFEPVAAGRYSIALTYPAQRPRQKTLEVIIAEGENREVTVQFQPLVRVAGLAKRGGAPYEGLIAFVARGNVAAEDFARADATGAYAIELEPGEYVVGRPGQPGTAQLTVPPAPEYAANLTLD
ncbi:MAG: carboxypeptidase-like regulatory domain-containing protein [Candidatus Sumerlaeaceae bacterium]|nr:carboxypeptidase-like regulatory domain-containing protein [Candidatus Sumerlaeaceae bacterium]